ncbi:MAG TPA: hypothetical protein VGQ67_06325, partial [Candidatus Polarisedimenticolia bacterium]|nr:hypothetical protein [Candidatus Polarisedimenticolia bacterium]
MRGMTAASGRRPRPVRDRVLAVLPGLGVWFLALLLGAPVRAQDQVRVRAQVDRVEMMEGEDLRLVVEINGPSLDRVGPPDLSDLGDFTLSGG